MDLHFNIDLTEHSLEIIWLVTHLANSKNTELIIKITNSKLYKSIISSFYRETFDTEMIEKILWFIHNLIIASKKIDALSKDKIKELTRISSGLLYYQNQEMMNYCLDILLELVDFEGNLVKNIMVEEGILNKLLRLSDDLQNKICKEYIKEKKEIFIDSTLKIVNIFGALITNHKKDKELIEVT